MKRVYRLSREYAAQGKIDGWLPNLEDAYLAGYRQAIEDAAQWIEHACDPGRVFPDTPERALRFAAGRVRALPDQEEP